MNQKFSFMLKKGCMAFISMYVRNIRVLYIETNKAYFVGILNWVQIILHEMRVELFLDKLYIRLKLSYRSFKGKCLTWTQEITTWYHGIFVVAGTRFLLSYIIFNIVKIFSNISLTRLPHRCNLFTILGAECENKCDFLEYVLWCNVTKNSATFNHFIFIHKQTNSLHHVHITAQSVNLFQKIILHTTSLSPSNSSLLCTMIFWSV